MIYPIVIPLAGALLAFAIPRRLALLTKVLALVVVGLTLHVCVQLYLNTPATWTWDADWLGESLVGATVLRLDALAGFMLLGVGLFAAVMVLYSVGFLEDDRVSPRAYYANFLWVLATACGSLMAADLITLTVFWGMMGIPFFLLINLGSNHADTAAKKTLIVLGATDSLMILGLSTIYVLTGSFDMAQKAILVDSGPAALACLCLVAAAFAKAGAMPLHSWVPDVAESAPVPVAALLPASLDKLLGIYLMARIALELFVLPPMLRNIFMLLGALTVMGAVMLALVQHNLRKLLGCCAVSQVGYMVLGIGTGTPIGVVGGLFHMLNHAIYKSCLFLTAGAAEKRTGTGELDKMGGLARGMPVTFVAASIAAMAISGVPPLNGFVSKWMVYQGLVQLQAQGHGLAIVLLVAAMFGSALTLASFVKVIHSVFLGQPKQDQPHRGPKPNLLMGLPMVLLALLCVVFGIWAFPLALRAFVLPAVPALQAETEVAGLWQPGTATMLLCVGLLAGLLFVWMGTLTHARTDEPYIGGEAGDRAEPYRYSGVDFYRTISEMPALKPLYAHAERHWYDLYDLGRRLTFYVTGVLRAVHSGLLLTYVSWCVFGLVVLLWVFSPR